MKRALFLAMAILVIAAPAFAGVWTHTTVDVSPLVPCTSGGPGLIPGVLCLNPGFIPAVDLITGNAIIDPNTGKQRLDPTFENYMSAATIPGVIVTYQSAILEKKHPVRKAACNFQWPADPLVQISKERINLCWPLLLETNGTTFTLTVNYSTNKPVSLNGMRASRVHTEIWVWNVKSDTWADLENRINYFSIHPAGVCELFAINQVVRDHLFWFINGAPALPGINAVLGLKDLGLTPAAAKKFGELEAYIDEQGCIDPCDYGQGQPIKGAMGISNNSVLPVASVLLNDVWAVGKALGILTDAD